MADVPMNAARFAALLDAYGADPRRWPAEERAAALAFAADDPAAPAMLAAAADLDGLIEMAPPQPADAALRDAIIASAGTGPPPRLSLWWAGAGLGAALAGAAAGALTVAVMAPGVGHDLAIDQMAVASTAFGDFDDGAVR